MRPSKYKAEKLSKVSKMPPSYHKLPGKEYDPKNAETIKWMIQQPELLEYLWDHVKQSKFVEYDKETGLWIGVDYDG